MTETPPTFDRWLHDVKNQLSIILGFSEILLEEMEESDTRRRDLVEINTAAERALDAIGRAPRPDQAHAAEGETRA